MNDDMEDEVVRKKLISILMALMLLIGTVVSSFGNVSYANKSNETNCIVYKNKRIDSDSTKSSSNILGQDERGIKNKNIKKYVKNVEKTKKEVDVRDSLKTNKFKFEEDKKIEPILDKGKTSKTGVKDIKLENSKKENKTNKPKSEESKKIDSLLNREKNLNALDTEEKDAIIEKNKGENKKTEEDKNKEDKNKVDETDVEKNELEEQTFIVKIANNSNNASIHIKGFLPKEGYATARSVVLPDDILSKGQKIVTAYNIKIFDGMGKEYQPVKPVRVSISDDKVKNELTKLGRKKFQVIHIGKSGVPDNFPTAIVASENIVSFNASSFSIYAFAAETRDAKRAPKKVETNVVDFNIEREKTENPPNIFKYYEGFKIKIKWDAKKYGKTLKKGDYFEIEIPKEFILAHEITADLKAKDGAVLGHMVATPKKDGGAKITVTFDKYVENHENIEGELYLYSRFNSEVYKKNTDGSYTITYTFNGKNHQHNVEPKPIPSEEEYFAKWSNRESNGLTKAKWVLRLNFKKGIFDNVVIEDELKSDTGTLPRNIEYIPESFSLKCLDIEPDGKLGTVHKTFSYDQFKNFLEFRVGRQAFTFKMSEFLKSVNFDQGKLNKTQWFLTYNSTYERGLKIVNRATFKARQEMVIRESHYQSVEAGGSGGGDLTRRIKIKKEDADNPSKPLANAKFIIKKIGDTTGKVFKLVTDDKGEAITEYLSLGEYEIIETDAPLGYILDSSPKKVKVLENEATIITITNKKIEKTRLSVEKKWKLFDGSTIEENLPKSIKVRLFKKVKNSNDTPVEVEKADGKVYDIELTKENGWKGEFTELLKSDKKTGKDLEYSIKELNKYGNPVESGNTVVYTGADNKDENYNVSYSTNGGIHVITNTRYLPPTPKPGKTRVLVKKIWSDGTPGADSVRVRLYVKVKDSNAEPKYTGKEILLNKVNKWSGIFADLDKENAENKVLEYSVKEVKPGTGAIPEQDYVVGEGGRIKFGNKSYIASYNKVLLNNGVGANVVITNTPEKPLIPPTPNKEYKNIRITKKWIGTNIKGKVYFILEKKINDKWEPFNTVPYELNDKNNYTIEIKVEKSDAKYRVVETNKYGVRIKDGKITIDGINYEVSYEGNEKEGLVIVNKEIPKKPNEPGKPNKPNEPKTPRVKKPKKVLPRTGDYINPDTYAYIACIVGIIIFLFAGIKKRNAKKKKIK